MSCFALAEDAACLCDTFLENKYKEACGKMKKIAILNCLKANQNCSGNGCFKALN